MRICENGTCRDATQEEIKEFESGLVKQPTPEPDRLTALELAVAELGAVMMTAMGGMSNG